MQYYFCVFQAFVTDNLVISKNVVFLPRCFVIQRRHVKSPATTILVINFNISFHDWPTDFPHSATGCHGSFFFLLGTFVFPQQSPPLSSVPAARAAGWRTRLHSSPDCVRYADLSGVNKMSSLRDELFFRNFQKYGAVIPLLGKKGCTKCRVVV